MSLSDYEQQRLAKIAENHRMLVALGLETAIEEMAIPKETAAKKQPVEPVLTEGQRTSLANASQWLERFELWLRGVVSETNANATVARVRDLVSGQGVHLKGYGRAFEGRAISITHTPFHELFMTYAHSHFYPGAAPPHESVFAPLPAPAQPRPPQLLIRIKDDCPCIVSRGKTTGAMMIEGVA